MYAWVATWSNGAWQLFGHLATGNANTVGILVPVGDPGEGLAGANTQSAPDRYRAPELPTGRYLICTTLAEPDNQNEVCGELSVG